MNELERELYLFERDERRERERARRRALNQAQRDQAAQERTEERARRARPAADKAAHDSAIGRFAAARQQREKRAARRRGGGGDEGDEDDDEGGAGAGGARARGRASAADTEEDGEADLAGARGGGDEDEDEDDARRYGARGARAYDEGSGSERDDDDRGAGYGDAVDDEEEEEMREPVDLPAILKVGLLCLLATAFFWVLASLPHCILLSVPDTQLTTTTTPSHKHQHQQHQQHQHNQQMQLKRSVLEQWVDKPFFDDAVVGAVVRIGMGTYADAAGQQHTNYLVMRVVGVLDRPNRPYTFPLGGTARTTKHLVLEDAGSRAPCAMATISSQDITPDELARFQRHCERSATRLPTKRDAAAAAERIRAALGYRFTAEDIQRKLAARREKGEVVGSLVTEKARLRGLLEAALSAGDAAAAAEHRARLDGLEAAHAARLAAVAGSSKAAMARINARNKEINFEKALKNVSNRPGGDAGREGGVDVFSRRQTQSKVYWSTGRKRDGDGGGGAGGGAVPTTPEKAAAAAAGGAGAGGGPGAAATAKLTRAMSQMDPAELIAVLNVDIDFDAAGGGNGGGGNGGNGGDAAAAAAARRMLGAGRWQPSAAAQEFAASLRRQERPSMSLTDWLAASAANQAAAPQ